MNIHPIIVHFPIALLTVYALFEIISIKKLQHIVSWFYIKFTFLVIGTLGIFVALYTGDIAEGIMGRSDLIENHNTWAVVTAYIFVFILLIYVTKLSLVQNWIEQLQLLKPNWTTFTSIAKKIQIFLYHFYAHRAYLVILSLAGLISVTITGALGGAIVYGPDADPAVTAVLKLLGMYSN